MTCERPPPVPSVHQTLDEMDFERGLWYPALTGDLPRIRTLLTKGKDPNSEDKNGYTPLHYAARCGFATICSLLLEHGADINKSTRAGGATALHRAALAGNDDTVILLIKYGANLHAQDADGRIPLHRAVEANKPTSVALLLEASPLSCKLKDKFGKTPRNYIIGNDKVMREMFDIIEKPQTEPKENFSLLKDIPQRGSLKDKNTSEEKVSDNKSQTNKIVKEIVDKVGQIEKSEIKPSSKRPMISKDDPNERSKDSKIIETEVIEVSPQKNSMEVTINTGIQPSPKRPMTLKADVSNEQDKDTKKTETKVKSNSSKEKKVEELINQTDEDFLKLKDTGVIIEQVEDSKIGAPETLIKQTSPEIVNKAAVLKKINKKESKKIKKKDNPTKPAKKDTSEKIFTKDEKPDNPTSEKVQNKITAEEPDNQATTENKKSNKKKPKSETRDHGTNT